MPLRIRPRAALGRAGPRCYDTHILVWSVAHDSRLTDREVVPQSRCPRSGSRSAD